VYSITVIVVTQMSLSTGTYLLGPALCPICWRYCVAVSFLPWPATAC